MFVKLRFCRVLNINSNALPGLDFPGFEERLDYLLPLAFDKRPGYIVS